uniref:SGNH hydrolase-type esterase domain-containing protein n=1 Tax=Calcidiscus leptoporus TaxID=127549 RepID=A0A7S0NYU3_9EUKA|mmetsp:Transcript_41000/g.95739  ORF Transcript_41000/g.95739 Transcript_41000/m.95739 type:complete len:313 (+) Transcript_41000:143-1081(+)|eukprot:CAMPEP_0119376632 /NCGR_PEP_ID=MMETSP1334-20130426/40373_1 /TAXON_ID=127549 /ORGANISM="Calcidiscus leptoporus, Strain RCC1130" /LENGTH=312 /DNA_ID=CAMNT_0007395239 /DNA_START=143 /DNA_END=1081 /DNA_ORIENTATION=+
MWRKFTFLRVSHFFRNTTAGAAVLTGCAGAQALYLQRRYEPLPEARGPLSGVARSAQQARTTTEAPRLPFGSSRLEASSLDPLLPRLPPRGRKNILFVGDSLITGVGCSQERSHGPALPRAVAEFLSKALRVDVSWVAIGETAADVRALRTNLVPLLSREVEAMRERGQHVDAVVIICGLNDFKNAYRSAGNTASDFRTELSSLVGEVKQHAGVQCTVVLPALPIHRAPVFDGIWPLQSFLGRVAALWDEQKAHLAHRLRCVAYVRNAERDEWWSGKQYWAVDGIHPNDEGYRIWGEHIAHGILPHLVPVPS